MNIQWGHTGVAQGFGFSVWGRGFRVPDPEHLTLSPRSVLGVELVNGRG